MVHPLIKNPHLNGDTFIMKGGPIGILLVHGFKATTAEMRPLGEFLHSRGYTVSSPLLPGHNTSPEDANRYTWKDWIAAVDRAYSELAVNCEHTIIGGESMGALLILYLATYHPEISGILAYAPALEIITSKAARLGVYLFAPFLPYIKEKDSNDDLPWRGYQAIPLKGVIQLLKLQKETKPRLDLIRRPILIIQGRRDARIPPEVPQMLYDKVSSVHKEIHWMENSSHCVVIDIEKEQVQSITDRFIQKSLGYSYAT